MLFINIKNNGTDSLKQKHTHTHTYYDTNEHKGWK